MAKKEYYGSDNELQVGIEKLVGLTKEKATFITDALQESKPPAKLLSRACRDLSYMDLPLTCLEYMWIGCEGASIKQKIFAKAAYLLRVNEKNHPRVKMLFTLEENMKVLGKDEEDSLNKYMTKKGGLI